MISMKVAVLGGAGTIGRGVISELAGYDEVESIKACEIESRFKEAKKVEKKVGDKVSATVVDILDPKLLNSVLKDTDLVINCAGPFFKLAPPAIRAAVGLGIAYIDIMDDPDPMRKILEEEELARTARDSGALVIMGLGSTPGLSNILAKYCANKLQTVERVDISWAFTSPSSTGAGGAVSEHMLHVMNKGWTYKNGQLVDIKPLVDGKAEQEFAELGILEVYDIGHPEPVMVPRGIKGVKEVTTKAGMVPMEMLQIYQVLSKLGMMRTEREQVGNCQHSPREMLKARLSNIPMEELFDYFKLSEYPPIFELRVEVNGEGPLGETSYVTGFVDVHHEMETYVPPSLAAVMIANEKISDSGIFTPEEIIDPAPFLKKVADKGVPLYEWVRGKRSMFS